MSQQASNLFTEFLGRMWLKKTSSAVLWISNMDQEAEAKLFVGCYSVFWDKMTTALKTYACLLTLRM